MIRTKIVLVYAMDGNFVYHIFKFVFTETDFYDDECIEKSLDYFYEKIWHKDYQYTNGIFEYSTPLPFSDFKKLYCEEKIKYLSEMVASFAYLLWCDSNIKTIKM